MPISTGRLRKRSAGPSRRLTESGLSPFLGNNQEVLARLRQNPPDVLHLNDPGPFFELKEEGLLRPRQLQTSAKVPAWLKDTENSWIAPRATAALLVHRTQGEERETPKTWRGLEGFKDRLVLPDPEGSATSFYWSMTAVNLYGWDFLRGLAKNQLLIEDVSPQALTLVAQGDRGAALAVEGDAAWRALQRGEPLSLTFPEEGVPVVPAPAALIKGSPHPKAGELLLEFLLSDQVQKLFALKGIYPSRADIPPPEGLPALEDVSLLQPNWELVARRRSELQKELRGALNLPPLEASPSVERLSQAPDETDRLKEHSLSRPPFLRKLLSRQESRRFTVHQPEQLSSRGADELRWQAFRPIVLLKDRPQRFCFLSASDENDDADSVVEHRGGQRDPMGVELLDPGGDHVAPLLEDGVGPREDRGGVPIWAQPQQDQIKLGQLPRAQPEEFM